MLCNHHQLQHNGPEELVGPIAGPHAALLLDHDDDAAVDHVGVVGGGARRGADQRPLHWRENPAKVCGPIAVNDVQEVDGRRRGEAAQEAVPGLPDL